MQKSNTAAERSCSASMREEATMLTAGGASAAAAAAKRRREQEEEEEMTLMNTDPSGAVEYKIIRSTTGAFNNPTKFRAALHEESRAGWELVEKLDDYRARLRRSTECRKGDAGLSQDPYRTQVGISETALAIWILVGVVVGLALLIGVMVALLR
jgi:hypothetical protein